MKFAGPSQSVQRRRGDPRVTLSIQFENIVNELRGMPAAAHFLMPVNQKLVPVGSYTCIISMFVRLSSV